MEHSEQFLTNSKEILRFVRSQVALNKTALVGGSSRLLPVYYSDSKKLWFPESNFTKNDIAQLSTSIYNYIEENKITNVRALAYKNSSRLGGWCIRLYETKKEEN